LYRSSHEPKGERPVLTERLTPAARQKTPSPKESRSQKPTHPLRAICDRMSAIVWPAWKEHA
jgi:hypothetical protein